MVLRVRFKIFLKQEFQGKLEPPKNQQHGNLIFGVFLEVSQDHDVAFYWLFVNTGFLVLAKSQ